jgi:pyruvate,water dikinase
MAEEEAITFRSLKLGDWLLEHHSAALEILLEEMATAISSAVQDRRGPVEWDDGELDRFSEQLRDNIENPKEAFYRQEMERFRAIFHKPVIYSSWDWTFTVEDAMHHAGFATYEEQEAALAVKRSMKW